MADYRLPPSMRIDSDLVDAIHQAVVGADDFDTDLDAMTLTIGQRALVTLLLVDAEISNGGFAQLHANSTRELLPAARHAAELIGATEHRELLDAPNDDAWYALDDELVRRMKAYVDAHPDEFFADTAAARANADRVLAQRRADDEWMDRVGDEIDREIEAQEWLVSRFGDRGFYSEISELLILHPSEMHEAFREARDAGYEPQELAFFRDRDGPVEWTSVDGDADAALDAGVARFGAEWVAVELR